VHLEALYLENLTSKIKGTLAPLAIRFLQPALEIDDLCCISGLRGFIVWFQKISIYSESTKLFTDFTELFKLRRFVPDFSGGCSAVEFHNTSFFFRNRTTRGFAVLPKSKRSVPLRKPGSTGPVD
jgi:hypothetical protein